MRAWHCRGHALAAAFLKVVREVGVASSSRGVRMPELSAVELLERLRAFELDFVIGWREPDSTGCRGDEDQGNRCEAGAVDQIRCDRSNRTNPASRDWPWDKRSLRYEWLEIRGGRNRYLGATRNAQQRARDWPLRSGPCCSETTLFAVPCRRKGRDAIAQNGRTGVSGYRRHIRHDSDGVVSSTQHFPSEHAKYHARIRREGRYRCLYSESQVTPTARRA